MVRYASVCSGIEAPSVAWCPLAWQPVFFSEIEPFPCAVLQHHYPHVPNLGDMTKFREWPDYAIDVFIGGTPCQSFSVAGLRKGLANPRGNLTLTFLGAVDRYRPRWVVWENVPGVLSDDTGAFGAFLGGLGQLGYGFAYRILDAQYFGVAQRRRRVFVVGHIGGAWQRAAAVLFERASLRGDSAPSRETGKRVAGTFSARTKGGGGLGTDFDLDGGVIGAVSAKWSKGTGGPSGDECQNLVAFNAKDHGQDALEDLSPTLRSGNEANGNANGGVMPAVAIIGQLVRSNQGSGGNRAALSPDEPHGTLERNGSVNAIAFTQNQCGDILSGDVTAAISTNQNATGRNTAKALVKHGVRRLTPRECERLQGFPDDYTLTPYRGKPACDGPRYKALGNSMATPVVRWIGERIQMVEAIAPFEQAA